MKPIQWGMYDKDFEICVMRAKAEDPKSIFSDDRAGLKIPFVHVNIFHVINQQDLLTNTVVRRWSWQPLWVVRALSAEVIKQVWQQLTRVQSQLCARVGTLR